MLLPFELLAQETDRGVQPQLQQLKSDQSIGYHAKVAYCDSLLEIVKAQHKNCDVVSILLFKADLYSKKGEYKSALHALNFSKRHLQSQDCSDETIKANLYLHYANLYTFINENKRAINYLQKGLDYCLQELPNSDILVQFYNTKAYQYTQLDSQLYYLKAGIRIADKIGNLNSQELILSSLGFVYAESGNNQLATKYITQALKIAKKRNAFGSLSALYNNLAGLSSSPWLRGKYLDSSLYYANLKGDLPDIQFCKENRAWFYYDQGEYEKAFLELGASIELKDSIYNQNKIKAFAEMEQKFEADLKTAQIELLSKENEIERIKASRNLGINFGLGGALIGIIFVALAFYKQNKKNQTLNIQLVEEKSISDALLLNILPSEVAEELKSKGEAEARLIEEVTVLFTDFKGFTALSEQLSPKELVKDLHECFTAFDNIMQKHGLEKIKTIGDAYMAAGGLPTPNSSHALDVVNAALEIKEFIERMKLEKMAIDRPFFEIRIGVHTGPVVAGIVGVKKFSYDIWGDTVNTASRMESSAETGKVNISGATLEHLKHLKAFRFEPRGKIEAKGKGAIEMFYVERIA